ncbi:hypothetical protein T12_13798 [Trichinella patagoniensis]|uniref:Uncharacterized protein n=2 Tax=Trichinella TaxID=6333 RepID=A0A0V0ZW72_9BILA|nr:hypothetical protein T12_13798 [Trichinella patagoniensis]
MVVVMFVLLDEDVETMDLVGARSLNPLGVRHIGARMPRAEVSCPLVLFATVCLATAESLCLFEINGLLLRIFAHAKSAGCLLCCVYPFI